MGLAVLTRLMQLSAWSEMGEEAGLYRSFAGDVHRDYRDAQENVQRTDHWEKTDNHL